MDKPNDLNIKVGEDLLNIHVLTCIAGTTLLWTYILQYILQIIFHVDYFI